MKKIIFSLLILFQFNISYCCSILCGVPKKFNITVYILEGTVTGHAGNFNHKNILGEFALLQIKISKTFYSPKVVDEINLIILGLNSDCRDIGEPLEEMKKNYPVGTIVSFFAFESDWAQTKLSHR